MAIISILVGLALGFGAVQELVVRGIRGGEVQPGIVGSIAAVASLLFIVSGILDLRDSPHARRIAIAAALLSIAIHVYGALPPRRNVGPVARILGVGWGISLLAVHLWKTRSNATAV